MSARFRKRPVEVEAVRWDGTNIAELERFCGIHFETIHMLDRGDDPDNDAQVFDELHSTWVPFASGDWVVRGVRGELYPCKADVFAETYEAVEPR